MTDTEYGRFVLCVLRYRSAVCVWSVLHGEWAAHDWPSCLCAPITWGLNCVMMMVMSSRYMRASSSGSDSIFDSLSWSTVPNSLFPTAWRIRWVAAFWSSNAEDARAFRSSSSPCICPKVTLYPPTLSGWCWWTPVKYSPTIRITSCLWRVSQRPSEPITCREKSHIIVYIIYRKKSLKDQNHNEIHAHDECIYT